MLTEDPKKWWVMPKSVDSFTTWPAPSSATRPYMALACELYKLVPRGVITSFEPLTTESSHGLDHFSSLFHHGKLIWVSWTHPYIGIFTPGFPVANGDFSQNCWKLHLKSRSFNWWSSFSIFRQTVVWQNCRNNPKIRKCRTLASLGSASLRSPQCSPSGQEMESLGSKSIEYWYWLKTWFDWVEMSDTKLIATEKVREKTTRLPSSSSSLSNLP